jgi:hypothetical protein
LGYIIDEEYNRRARRRRLFADLQSYQTRCLAFIEGLQEGQLGTLNEAGEDTAHEVASSGYTLLDQFDLVFGFATDEGGGG